MREDWQRAISMRRVLLIVGFVLLVIIGILAVRALDTIVGLTAPQATSPSLAEICILTGLAFPADSRVIGSQLAGHGGRFTLCARVHFSRAELQDFVRAIPRPHSPCHEITDAMMVPSQPWWNPDRARDMLEVRWRRSGRATVRAMVSVESPGETIVFIHATR